MTDTEIVSNRSSFDLLSVEEMYAADRAAVEGGVSGTTLMEAAGAGVVRAITRRWAPRPTVVLCGPGSNGGDGFVIARRLRQAGAWDVRLALLGSPDRLHGDARVMADSWDGDVLPLDPKSTEGAALIVDAIFGAGLSRDIDGITRATLESANAADAVRVAVDVPSGIHGDTGHECGYCFRADLSVTFFRKKPGHVLLPGRMVCGEVEVVDIGIPASVLEAVAPRVAENDPALWSHLIPVPGPQTHKYRRGHALIVSGGPESTGAARLAARAALRIGSGLVTVACPPNSLIVNASQLTAVMTDSFAGSLELKEVLGRRRRNAVLLGPGNGVTKATRTNVLTALQSPVACVLDADALTVFADQRDVLGTAISGLCVLTPHEGEFTRLFGEASQGQGKVDAVRQAAGSVDAVVLLKGADTVIASPDGRVVINGNASPELATAGTGDVLSGLVVGLLAQGMEPFEAASAAAWMHGAAAEIVGPGLIAEDLSDALPDVLRGLR